MLNTEKSTQSLSFPHIDRTVGGRTEGDGDEEMVKGKEEV